MPRVRPPCEYFSLEAGTCRRLRTHGASPRRESCARRPPAASEKGWAYHVVSRSRRLSSAASLPSSGPVGGPARRQRVGMGDRHRLHQRRATSTMLGRRARRSGGAERASAGRAVSSRRSRSATSCSATPFNALDGGGANVGRGQRYTRVPRADLQGGGEWFNHTPIRVTGPNAGGCFECHEQPFEDGAGTAALNVHRDPFRTGLIGAVRRAQHAARLRARRDSAAGGRDDRRARCRSAATGRGRVPLRRHADRSTLDAKGVNFGTLSATRTDARRRAR